MPDLSAYRRRQPLTLADVNRLARQRWSSWNEVDPPRHFPGSPRNPEVRPGEIPVFDDPWWQLWDSFRRHLVDLHYDELSRWAHDAGIPRSASGRRRASWHRTQA